MDNNVNVLNLKKEPEHFDVKVPDIKDIGIQDINIKEEQSEPFETSHDEEESLSHLNLPKSPGIKVHSIEEIYVQQNPYVQHDSLTYTENEPRSMKTLKLKKELMDSKEELADSKDELVEEEKKVFADEEEEKKELEEEEQMPLDFSGYHADIGVKRDGGIDSIARSFNIEDLIGKNIVNEFLNGEHMLGGHKPDRFCCSICTYETKLKQRMTTHMRIHTGDTFKCELCPYESIRKSDLKRHFRTHSGEKTFKCEICSYCSARSSDIKRHLRTHTGEKPFKCPLCSFSSATSSHLTTHIRVHTGERPFKCTLCAFKSSQSSHLRTHLRSHTGEKPFECGLCSFTTAQNSHLRRHLKSHCETKERRRKQKKGTQKRKIETDDKIQSGSSISSISSPKELEEMKTEIYDRGEGEELSFNNMPDIPLRLIRLLADSTALPKYETEEGAGNPQLAESNPILHDKESKKIKLGPSISISKEIEEIKQEISEQEEESQSIHNNLPRIPIRLLADSTPLPKYETEEVARNPQLTESNASSLHDTLIKESEKIHSIYEQEEEEETPSSHTNLPNIPLQLISHSTALPKYETEEGAENPQLPESSTVLHDTLISTTPKKHEIKEPTRDRLTQTHSKLSPQTYI